MGKRKMNWPATRRRYQERIRELPDDLWQTLDGAYLGTFEIYSTVEAMDEDDHMDCFAGVAFRVAVEKGFLPLGITSVRKSRACTYARPCWMVSHGQRPPSCTSANTVLLQPREEPVRAGVRRLSTCKKYIFFAPCYDN